MDGSTDIYDVWQALGGNKRLIAPVSLVKVFGDMACAAFVYRALELSMSAQSEGGWFQKTGEDWQADLILSPKQVRRCVQASAGVVEVRLKGLPAKNYYRVNVEKLWAAMLKADGV